MSREVLLVRAVLRRRVLVWLRFKVVVSPRTDVVLPCLVVPAAFVAVVVVRLVIMVVGVVE